jgi:hypothetical protein
MLGGGGVVSKRKKENLQANKKNGDGNSDWECGIDCGND